MQLSKEVRTKICQVVKKMLNVLNYYIPVLGCHQKIYRGFTGIVQFFFGSKYFLAGFLIYNKFHGCLEIQC